MPQQCMKRTSVYNVYYCHRRNLWTICNSVNGSTSSSQFFIFSLAVSALGPPTRTGCCREPPSAPTAPAIGANAFKKMNKSPCSSRCGLAAMQLGYHHRLHRRYCSQTLVCLFAGVPGPLGRGPRVAPSPSSRGRSESGSPSSRGRSEGRSESGSRAGRGRCPGSYAHPPGRGRRSSVTIARMTSKNDSPLRLALAAGPRRCLAPTRDQFSLISSKIVPG